MVDTCDAPPAMPRAARPLSIIPASTYPLAALRGPVTASRLNVSPGCHDRAVDQLGGPADVQARVGGEPARAELADDLRVAQRLRLLGGDLGRRRGVDPATLARSGGPARRAARRGSVVVHRRARPGRGRPRPAREKSNVASRPGRSVLAVLLGQPAVAPWPCPPPPATRLVRRAQSSARRRSARVATSPVCPPRRAAPALRPRAARCPPAPRAARPGRTLTATVTTGSSTGVPNAQRTTSGPTAAGTSSRCPARASTGTGRTPSKRISPSTGARSVSGRSASSA